MMDIYVNGMYTKGGWWSTGQDIAIDTGDLAPPGECEIIIAPGFPSDPVGGYGKHPVFEAPGYHCSLAIWHHQVRRVCNNLRAF